MSGKPGCSTWTTRAEYQERKRYAEREQHGMPA